jgi:hypothetical protein
MMQIAKSAAGIPNNDRMDGLAKVWCLVRRKRKSARLNNSEIRLATRNLRPVDLFPVRGASRNWRSIHEKTGDQR